MENDASVTDVARNFADYINRVAYRGEQFVLLRGKKPVAELRPIPAGKQLRELPDLLKALPRLSEDEANRFARDLARANAEGGAKETLRDPWVS